MITRKKFDLIKEKHGKYCSWAIWTHEDKKAKSNMGDLTVLDPEINNNLLSNLNPNVVLVALNFSMVVDHEPFGNFHSDGTHRQDYKTRYALRDSQFWGGYMTDIIKNFPEKESGNVANYLKSHKDFEKENIGFFRQELQDIGAENPIIVAFGDIVYDILARNFHDEFKILKMTHYAHFISKEKLKEEVLTLENEHLEK
jgi:hypothetical protein